MTKVQRSFYLNEDTVFVAKNLLGKVLCTNIEGVITSGIISETEAYLGETDAASHAFGGKHTKRTSSMFNNAGHSYVYLCYGIHNLFNVVTGPRNFPHAVLIRNVIPLNGIQHMLNRREKENIIQISNGPGTLSVALGINLSHDKVDLLKNVIWIEDRNIKIKSKNILITPRVGIDYAGKDSKLPYRFVLNELFHMHL